VGPALRAPLALLALAAACASLAGCEVTSASKERKSSLKVLHANGESFVPAHADRLVTLESEALDDSLALGFKPVGAATTGAGDGLPGYLGRRTAGVARLGPASRPDLRRIASLDPDLILGSRHTQGRLYRRLEDIATTINVERAGDDWKIELRLYAEALQRTDPGERLLDGYDAHAARVRRALPHGGAKVSVVRTEPGGVRAYSKGSFSGSILADLGLRRPRAQESVTPSRRVAAKDIASLDADFVFLARAPGSDATYRLLSADPRWQGLRGRVVPVSDDAWITGQGYLAARRVLSDVQRALAGGPG
jgi:iron complex transport system substrate-binding protein